MPQDTSIPAPPSGTIVMQDALSIPPPPSGTIVPSTDSAPTLTVGAPSSQPAMQKSNVGIALGSDSTASSAINNPQQPAERFALDHPEQQKTLLGASAIGAGGALATEALPAFAPLAEHLAGHLLEHGTELATKYPNLVTLAGKLGWKAPASTIGALLWAYEHFKK